MGENIKKSYSEVCSIINLLEADYKNKIPTTLIEFFEKEKSSTYVPYIDPNIPLEEQALQQNTIDVLAMLKLQYWCNDKDEKEKLLKLLSDNERKFQEELSQKCNPQDLFKNRSIIESNNARVKETTTMVEYKRPNFLTIVLEKIRKLCRK